uniref:F-box protein n=1 Tax=Strongyloides papillosus TaxID=174720 RepID=A0A0N5C0L5_STREA
MAFHDQVDEDLSDMKYYSYTKTINVESVGELPVLLKVFGVRDLYKFSVRVDGTPGVFGILDGLRSLNAIKRRSYQVIRFTKLLENNPGMKFLDIGSWSIRFLDSVSKEHFTVYRPCKIESGCGYNEIELVLHFGGNFKRLYRILRNDLSEFENVKDVTCSPNFGDELKFELNVDCKYCLKRRHQIKRFVEIELYMFPCKDFYL